MENLYFQSDNAAHPHVVLFTLDLRSMFQHVSLERIWENIVDFCVRFHTFINCLDLLIFRSTIVWLMLSMTQWYVCIYWIPVAALILLLVFFSFCVMIWQNLNILFAKS